jgi:ribonuclease J
MLELVRPRAFLPVHGTLHHLLRHAQLARECGVGDVMVVENGTGVRFGDDGLFEDARFAVGKIPIAIGGEPLDRETLGRRLDLARHGVVHVAVTFNGGRKIVAGPAVTAEGVPGVDEDRSALACVARGVVEQVERLRRVEPSDPRLAEEMRRAARRQLLAICGYRPIVEVAVLEAGD